MFEDIFPVDWEAFHFLRSKFLWLLIPVALIFIMGLINMRQEFSWKKVIAPHLRPFVIKKGSDGTKLSMQVILLLSLSFGILALAGPTWKKVEVPGKILETPVVILLDLSQSMMATDLQPTRLERAKFKINDFLKQNPQARVALVGFAGTAHTIVPLTRDYEIITSHIDGLSPNVMPFPGSDLEAAFVLADSVMNVTDAPGTVLVFSDDLDQDEFTAIQNFVQDNEDKVDILPMNTDAGADVPMPNSRAYFKDAEGNVVHSAIDKQVISQLSSLDRVSIHQLTLDDSDVELISKSISDNLKFTEKPEEKDNSWRDMGLLFVIPMLVLLLFWFRKGWVIYTLMFFVLSSCTDGSKIAGLWYTPDFQGQKLSEKGDYAQAAKRFEDPMRKGVANFKAGNYADAINDFKEDTTAHGAYNLGLAYFQSGDTLSARLAFQSAAELDPSFAPAQQINKQMQMIPHGEDSMTPAKAEEAKDGEDGNQGEAKDNNVPNESMENLGGGGQEATKKDMETQRQEETVSSNIHMGKELDEVPDDLNATTQQTGGKMLMRKIDDDPSLFLKKKFEFQVKEKKIKPKADGKKW
ncbi:VWA domain-containing protein [Algoriphagus chordae]|uniref:Ca-activated chloride channel family protein n=1 Tax=Algoriphagus chordae TaxID=237019 RepID=A0A2W7QIT6_9BACT|nr:VWA domain-containing protein [Algoriphagus chordae]PZX48518.1 Ca-activated chloride channel family protein [Algoriphagus chordae]